MNILICDDDREIVDAVEVYMKNAGYGVFKAYDGNEALEIIRKEEVHLLLLDVMKPNLDGIRTTKRIREEKKNIPIIIFSAKSENDDKVLGLDIGADDYITKPFSNLELVARVKAQLRRYTSFGSAVEKTGVFRSGELLVDDEAKTVTVDGEQKQLTAMEFEILKYLTGNAGRVFSVDQIYEAVRSEPAYDSKNTITVHIANIRKKIEINPREPVYLKVVRGHGYKIEKY